MKNGPSSTSVPAGLVVKFDWYNCFLKSIHSTGAKVSIKVVIYESWMQLTHPFFLWLRLDWDGFSAYLSVHHSRNMMDVHGVHVHVLIVSACVIDLCAREGGGKRIYPSWHLVTTFTSHSQVWSSSRTWAWLVRKLFQNFLNFMCLKSKLPGWSSGVSSSSKPLVLLIPFFKDWWLWVQGGFAEEQLMANVGLLCFWVGTVKVHRF